MKAYIEEHKISEDEYNQKMKDKLTRPKDTPMKKKNLIQKEFVEISQIREELKDLKE